LDKIIPKNEDGSINVRTAEGTTMDINIETLRGTLLGRKINSNGVAIMAVGLE
jgi:DUF4097 and DUF4098 domain-containing protein YvlB